MRHILLAIFVLFAAQPVPAALANHCGGMDGSHASHHAMQSSDTSMADCCDHDGSDTPDGCNSLSHCGACVAAVVMVGATATNLMINTVGQQFVTVTAQPLISTYSPPFRPPIG